MKKQNCVQKEDCGLNKSCEFRNSFLTSQAVCKYLDDEEKCVKHDLSETVANTFTKKEESLSQLEGDDYQEAGYSCSDVLLAGVFGVSAGFLGCYYMNRGSLEKQLLI